MKEKSSKDLLIFGGMGYVGLSVIQNLINSGYHPTILTPNINKTLSLDLIKRVKIIEGSITNYELVRELVKKRDAVINLVGFVDKDGNNPSKSLEVNCGGELNVLESLRQENPFAHHIFLGTRAQFGKIMRNGELINENQIQEPRSIYGLHKKICEEHINHYQSLYGLNCTSFRLVGIYGPSLLGELKHFTSTLIKKALMGKDLIINGDGSQIQDFIYISDLTNLIQTTLERRNLGVYNIGSGQGLPMNEIAREIIKKCGGMSSIKHRVLTREEDYLDQDGCIMDIKKIGDKTGWEPKINLYVGLDKTIKWYKDKGLQSR
jgi:UDP-glucose 4-epimerase